MDYDKIILRLNSVASWLRTAKEDETVRSELMSAADKTCRQLSDEIHAACEHN
ncbi:MAG: hypothetical protein ACI4WX_10125 [Aristaeellaceae bacterium]